MGQWGLHGCMATRGPTDGGGVDARGGGIGAGVDGRGRDRCRKDPKLVPAVSPMGWRM